MRNGLARISWFGCGGFFRQRDHDGISLGDGLHAIANQLQYFVEDEALGLEEVAIGFLPGGAAVADLFMEFGEGEERAHGLPARDRFEDEVALLQRRAGIRRFAIDSGRIGGCRIGTHSRFNGTRARAVGNQKTTFNAAFLNSLMVALARNQAHCQPWFDGAAKFERNSHWVGIAMSSSTCPTGVHGYVLRIVGLNRLECGFPSYDP